MQTATDAESTMLAAVRRDPSNTTARLVLADWWDEAGDARAELVRLVCEVQASGYADSPAWERLKYLAWGMEADWWNGMTNKQRLRVLMRYAEDEQVTAANAPDRWNLCRAVEYRLGFVDSTEGDGE